jgi:hypothetical protein
MPARRIPTNPDTPDWSLTEQQRTAVDLLVSGKNIQDTATALGVTRQTVSEWLHHHAGVQAAVNQRRQELWAEVAAGLRALLPRAVEIVQAELEGDTPLPAAVHVLKACGLYGAAAAPAGSTEPEEIAAQMQVAADVRQHAAEEAALAIQRRNADRFFSALSNGLTPSGS